MAQEKRAGILQFTRLFLFIELLGAWAHANVNTFENCDFHWNQAFQCNDDHGDDDDDDVRDDSFETRYFVLWNDWTYDCRKIEQHSIDKWVNPINAIRFFTLE